MTAVERLIPLAMAVGGRMKSPRWMTKEDRQQEAVLGLLRAAKNYDPSKGASLKTHAYPRMRGAVLDAIRKGSVVSRRGLAKGERCQIELGLKEVADVKVSVHSLMASGEEAELLRGAVAALPRELWFVVGGIYWGGVDQKELVGTFPFLRHKSTVSRLHAKAISVLHDGLRDGPLCPTSV